MSVKKPPALANWLLNRLRIPETNAPLAGDLNEEFQTGRSRAWYWRQTIIAVASQIRHNARASRLRLATISVSYLAQASVAYLLWERHLPAQVRPLYLALGAVIGLSNFLIVALALNDKWRARLSLLLDDPVGRGILFPVFDATAFVAALWGKEWDQIDYGPVILAPICFVLYLALYCMVAMCHRLSADEFAFVEVMWLGQLMFDAILRPVTSIRAQLKSDTNYSRKTP